LGVKKVRWGIIGCGNVTEVKSGPAFQLADNSELTAVMRRNAALAEDYAKRHQVPKWYDNAEALIADPEVDAVYIATPPDSHMNYAEAVAAAGKPVYVEKPMALNYAQCETMIKASEAAGVPLFVAYYRRALPRFLHIKKLIEQGEIGEVRYVQTTQTKKLTERGDELPWRLDPSVSGGGYFFDLASHTLDVLDFILGPIRDASGKAVNLGGVYAAEDTVSGAYQFESGVQGTGIWCFCGYENKEMNEIVGSKGKLSFSTFGHEPIVLTMEQDIVHFPFDPPKHIQQPLIQTIVNDLLGHGHCASTGLSAARTSRVMDEIVGNRR
jgi:1,5-anhydro-D-fructose reductase (1,5-anhydro-D-mannitol-forming)